MVSKNLEEQNIKLGNSELRDFIAIAIKFKLWIKAEDGRYVNMQDNYANNTEFIHD